MTTPPGTPLPDPSGPEPDAGAPPVAGAAPYGGAPSVAGAVPDAGAPLVAGAVPDGAAPSVAGAAPDRGALGMRTYDRILEPRSPRRLPLGDGTWHQLARAYVRVQLITQGAVLLAVLAVAVIVQTWTGFVWHWIPAGVVLLVTLVGLLITPRQARSFGYQLRRDDLVFRRGILWQRVVAVPYGRMQLVDITHGPLDRGFGIAQLKLVTAAAASGVTIPGLTQEAAEQLRDTLVAVAETRRTGL